MTRSENNSNKPAGYGWVWPALVVALLGGHALLVTGAMAISTALIPGAATAPAGYEEALAWDEQKARREASDRLGWALVLAPGNKTTPLGEREVEFFLRDAEGMPIEDALLSVRMYHLARPNTVIEHRFASGPYRSGLRLGREGFWKLDAEATRGGDRLIVDEEVWVPRITGETP